MYALAAAVLPELLTGRGAALLETVSTAQNDPDRRLACGCLFAGAIMAALLPWTSLPLFPGARAPRLLDAGARLFVDARLLFRFSTHLAGEISGACVATPCILVFLCVAAARTSPMPIAIVRACATAAGLAALVLALPIATVTAGWDTPPRDHTFLNDDLHEDKFSAWWTPASIFLHALWLGTAPALSRFRGTSHATASLARALAVAGVAFLAPQGTVARLTRSPYNLQAFAAHAGAAVLFGSMTASAHTVQECLASLSTTQAGRPVVKSIKQRRGILSFALIVAVAFEAHTSTFKLNIACTLFGILAPLALASA